MPLERPSKFNTTHWSLIAVLPDRADQTLDGRAQEALKHLCETYWQPLYAFARYSGWSTEDAQDLTQAFLTKVVESSGLSGARPERGRFRSYLLAAMKHFMANTREHAKAKKRGGGHRFVFDSLLPIADRVGMHNTPLSGFLGRPSAQLHDLEDLGSLGGRVVRTLMGRLPSTLRSEHLKLSFEKGQHRGKPRLAGP
ncbi:MAG: hypothetical protein AAGH71_04630 [Planctomycetota bacterium]